MSAAKRAYWSTVPVADRRRQTEPARRASVERRTRAADLLRSVEAGDILVVSPEESS